MERGSATRTYGRSAALLTAALGVAGAFVYLFFAVASHVLTADEYGLIVVLWSAMFLAISILFRPVELLLARSIAHGRASGVNSGAATRLGCQIQLVATGLFLALALLFRDQIEWELFNGDALLFWSLVASVVGFAAVYVIRGYLAGKGHFGLYALILLSDAACRGVFAVVLAVGVANEMEIAALAIAIPPAVSAALTYAAFRVLADKTSPAPADVEATGEFTLVEGGGFAVSVLAVMVAEQVFLNSGPLFALARDGEAAAGYVFNVLMLLRAPVLLFQATATSLLPHLTAMHATNREADFTDALRHTIGGIVIFTAVTGVVVLVAGPALMQLAFGDTFEYDRAGLLLMALGMGLYLVATTLSQAAFARGRAPATAVAWLVTAVAFSAWLLLANLEVERLVETGIAGSAAVLCVLLYRLVIRPRP
jgi:O-antigen/teichoic acid export membrane protein